MIKILLLTLPVIILSCFTAKAQNTDTTTYTNKKYHYSISIPRSWTENKQDEKGSKSFVGVSPAESDDDSFLENVTVAVTPNVDQRLKSFYKDKVNRIKFSVNNFHQTDEGDETIYGNKAKYVIYTIDYKGINLKMMTYILVVNKIAFVITGIAFESTFDQYKSKFKDIAESLVFEGK